MVADVVGQSEKIMTRAPPNFPGSYFQSQTTSDLENPRETTSKLSLANITSLAGYVYTLASCDALGVRNRFYDLSLAPGSGYTNYFYFYFAFGFDDPCHLFSRPFMS